MALCGVPSLLTTLQGFVPATAQAFERVLNVKGGPRHEDGGLVASDDHLLGSHISNWPAAFLILLRSQVSLPLSLMRAGAAKNGAVFCSVSSLLRVGRKCEILHETPKGR
jgi:hypothetical protein